MRTLLLDAGNTRLKWALCDNVGLSGAVSPSRALSNQGSLCYDEMNLAAQLEEALGPLISAGTGRTDAIDRVLLCNVAGEQLETSLREYLEAHRVQESEALTIDTVIAHADAFGVRSAYEQAAQLGVDRWAGLVAARHFIQRSEQSNSQQNAVCIVDCGTALTVDVLVADGRHAGGIIVPGMAMMMESLFENTDGISLNTWAQRSPLAVHSTADAVQAGVQAAMIGAVQQVLQECQVELGETPVCVLTGGNAEKLMSGLPNARHEPDWVLQGLAVMAAPCHADDCRKLAVNERGSL